MLFTSHLLLAFVEKLRLDATQVEKRPHAEHFLGVHVAPFSLSHCSILHRSSWHDDCWNLFATAHKAIAGSTRCCNAIVASCAEPSHRTSITRKRRELPSRSGATMTSIDNLARSRLSYLHRHCSCAGRRRSGSAFQDP